jgi:hypothetical protein
MRTCESPTSIPTRSRIGRLDKGSQPLSHVAKRPEDGCSWARRRPQTRRHTATTTTHWIAERMKLATAMQPSCGHPQCGSGARRRFAMLGGCATRRWGRTPAEARRGTGPGRRRRCGAGGGATLVSSCDRAMSIWACSLDGRLQVTRACKTYPNATMNSIGPAAQTRIHDKSININVFLLKK